MVYEKYAVRTRTGDTWRSCVFLEIMWKQLWFLADCGYRPSDSIEDRE
jgi:hypothetical protein